MVDSAAAAPEHEAERQDSNAVGMGVAQNGGSVGWVVAVGVGREMVL
jgi:hypothetical protein